MPKDCKDNINLTYFIYIKKGFTSYRQSNMNKTRNSFFLTKQFKCSDYQDRREVRLYIKKENTRLVGEPRRHGIQTQLQHRCSSGHKIFEKSERKLFLISIDTLDAFLSRPNISRHPERRPPRVTLQQDRNKWSSLWRSSAYSGLNG